MEHGAKPCLLDLVADTAGHRVAALAGPDPAERSIIPVKNTLAQGASDALIAGLLAVAALVTDTYRQFFDLVANQFAAGIANAQSYEAERNARAALAALDHAKTPFFFEREPRVPHAAHADARPAARMLLADPATCRRGDAND